MPKNPITATIANGGTKSTGVRTQGNSILHIDFPTMTGTSATLQGAVNDVDAEYATIGDEAAAISIISPSGRSVNLAPYYTYGYNFVRIVSGSAEAAERSVSVYVNDFLG